MQQADAPVSNGWVWMLRGAALYNLAVATPALVMESTQDSDRIIAVLVASFGLLYGLISHHPAKLALALWAGVVGKAGLLAVLVPAVIDGRQAAALAPVLVGDALFTLAFIAFLMRGLYTGRLRG